MPRPTSALSSLRITAEEVLDRISDPKDGRTNLDRWSAEFAALTKQDVRDFVVSTQKSWQRRITMVEVEACIRKWMREDNDEAALRKSKIAAQEARAPGSTTVPATRDPRREALERTYKNRRATGEDLPPMSTWVDDVIAGRARAEPTRYLHDDNAPTSPIASMIKMVRS
jgi:hypothetical protein